MKDFIDHLNKLKKQRLKDLEEQLQVELESKISKKSQALEAVEAQINRTKEQRKLQQKNQKQYLKDLDLGYKLSGHKRALVHQLCHDTISKHLSQPDHMNQWLANGLAVLEGQSGQLRTGVSLALIKQMVKSKDVEIVEDSQLAEDPGFIFENDQLHIIHTLSSYIADFTKSHQAEIATIIFEHD